MLHPRYEAPIASGLWSPQARAARMRYISDQYAINAIDAELIEPMTWVRRTSMIDQIKQASPVDVLRWKQHELETGHEIVGFLQAYLSRLPEEVHPYVHYGLTSSDLVEYEMHRAISNHTDRLLNEIGRLIFLLRKRIDRHADLMRAGRTHGQTAEITTLDHQFDVFLGTATRLYNGLGIYRQNHWTKTPGPVGNSGVRAPLLHFFDSTQIIPRDLLMGWASDYLQLASFLESLAMFIRLGCRSEIGEFQEGLSGRRQGSSAMPGKSNPIDSEKVCGLARIVRGYHLALSEVQGSMWEERDLSNSSTERIAVPGLAACVEHMLATMIQVLTNLQVNEDRISQNAQDPRTRANARQNEIQKTQKVGPIEASRLAKEQK